MYAVVDFLSSYHNHRSFLDLRRLRELIFHIDGFLQVVRVPYIGTESIYSPADFDLA